MFLSSYQTIRAGAIITVVFQKINTFRPKPCLRKWARPRKMFRVASPSLHGINHSNVHVPKGRLAGNVIGKTQEPRACAMFRNLYAQTEDFGERTVTKASMPKLHKPTWSQSVAVSPVFYEAASIASMPITF